MFGGEPQAWTTAVQSLMAERFYDPQIAATFLSGDPGVAAPVFE